MNHVKYGLGFILILAVILAASSLFFGGRHEPESISGLPEELEQLEQPGKAPAQETEAIATDRDINERTFDGELNTSVTEDTIEEPESNLDSVLINLTQEMARRGYAQGLSECIEGQFRENQGIENPKDLDAMLQICEGKFKVESQQSQQIRDVVLRAIAKAQNQADVSDRGGLQ